MLGGWPRSRAFRELEEYDASLPEKLSPVPLRLRTCEHTVDVIEFPGLELRETRGTRHRQKDPKSANGAPSGRMLAAKRAW